MSWLSGIVGKAEDLLNQVDQTAAVALQKNDSSSRTGTSFINSSNVPHHSHISSMKNSYQTAPQYPSSIEYAKSYASPSNPTTKSSPAVLKPTRIKSSIIEKDDEKLLEYLNSNETAFVPRKIPSSPKKHSPTHTTSQCEDAISNQGDAEVSENGEKHLAVQLDTTILMEEKSEPSVPEETVTLTEAKSLAEENLNIITPKNNLEAEGMDSLVHKEESDTQQSSNDTKLQKENELLTNEIKSLSQEIENSTRKNKELESEMKRMQRKLDHWNSQVSGSDHLIRDLQERETDLTNALNAKDSQLAVLRIRLQEADQELQVKRSLVEQLRSENERILQDHNKSCGLHNQTLDSLKEKLHETDSALHREKAAYKSIQAENMERLGRLEDEQQKLVESLTSTQKALAEEKAQNKDLSSQIKLANINLESLKQEFAEYKQKAQRILQSKEKVIASLKEAHTANQDGESTENFTTNTPVTNAEIEMLQQECETLREELQRANKQSENLQFEIQEMERISQSDVESCREQLRVLEDQLQREQQQRISLEQECSQQREELRYFHEDLARTKSNLQSRIQDRDSEIEKLRKQLTTKSLSNTSQSELEARLHSLTESLIQKQTVVEALSTEKNSLVLQLERLEQQLRESNSSGSRRQNTVVGIGGPEHTSLSERYRPNSSYFLVSPYDGPLARKMKRVYGIIDSFSIRSGVFLRRYPMARIFVIVYMFLLHLWVTVVLLTYKPEVHGPHYNLGSA